MQKRLYRSRHDIMLGGVCGGLGEHFDLDPAWFRLGFVLFAFSGGAGLVLYLAMWIVVPAAPAAGGTQGAPAPPEEAAADHPAPVPATAPATGDASPGSRGLQVLGALFVVLGLLLLGEALTFFSIRRWLRPDILGPALLVLLGLWLITQRNRAA